MKNFEHLTGVERQQLFRMAQSRAGGDSHVAKDLLDRLDPSLNYHELKNELARQTGGGFMEEAAPEADEAKYWNQARNYAEEQAEKKNIELKKEPKAEREPESKESVDREERRHKLLVERMRLRQQFREREGAKQRQFEAIKGVAGYAGKMFQQSISKHKPGSFRPNAGILPQRGTAPIQGAPRGWGIERGLVNYPKYLNGTLPAPGLINRNGMDVFSYYRRLQGQNPMLASGSPFRKSVGAAQFRGNAFGGTGQAVNVFIPHSTPQGRGVSLSPRSQRARASNPFGLKHSKRFRWL